MHPTAKRGGKGREGQQVEQVEQGQEAMVGGKKGKGGGAIVEEENARKEANRCHQPL